MEYKIEIQFIITLLHLPKIKRKTAYSLLKKLDQDILSLGELIELIGEKADERWKSILTIDDFPTALNLAYKTIQESAANNIRMVSILDDDYPKLLKSIADPPIILNYIGDITLLTNQPTIAIIGTRDPSAFGTRYATYAAEFFAKKGFNIISGLAKGCDTAAHLCALNANRATCAVLAHGLDIIYPKENKALAERIKTNGVIVSEYFIGTKLTKKNFVERDRIQAALSLGVFIIECDVNSGTMHTANYAILYNRVLICMKPPLRYFTETRVSGNQMLSQSGKAIAVYKGDELKELSVFLMNLFKTFNI